MLYSITAEACERLNLPPGTDQRAFTGPTIRLGPLAGYPVGILRWVKNEMKIRNLAELDYNEQMIVYMLLGIRNADHELLPLARFEDLAATDFELVPHPVTRLDETGDCGDCGMVTAARVHWTNGPAAGPTVEVGPTPPGPVPGSEEPTPASSPTTGGSSSSSGGTSGPQSSTP